MQKPRHSSTTPTRPATSNTGSFGYFLDENPATSTSGTSVTADWLNDVTDELANAVVGSGLTLSSTDQTQLLQAIKRLSNKNNNLVINGALEVWQRGTAFTAIPTATYSADRWLYHKAGTMVHTINRSSDVPTVTQAGQNFNYSVNLNLTTSDTSLAATDMCSFTQWIEGYNYKQLAGQKFTLSFWVKATVAGTYCVAFRNNGNGTLPDRSYVSEYVVNAANAWEKKTITCQSVPSGGTWDYQNGKGLGITFTLAAGTTFQTTQNAWQTGNYIATANQVNGTNGNTNIYLTGIKLEVGDLATEFNNDTFDTVVGKCQRYFEKSYDLSTSPGTITGVGMVVQEEVSFSYTAHNFTLHSFNVRKRATPATVIYNHLTGTANSLVSDSAAGGMQASFTVASPTFSVPGLYAGDRGFPAVTRATNGTGQSNARIYIQYTSDAELY
jgi:hypothetical protein